MLYIDFLMWLNDCFTLETEFVMAKKSQKELIPTVSAAEWDVMEVFWADGPHAARDVYAALSSKRDRKSTRLNSSH